MKRKQIHRPKWKRIAQSAKRKLNELKRERQFEPARHNPHLHIEVGNKLHAKAQAKAERDYEVALEKPRKMTKAQQKWHMEGFMSAQEDARRDLESCRKINDRLADERNQRQQRHELPKPALELIQKLMED